MKSDPDYESGENPTFSKKENTLGRLTTTRHQLSAVTGHRERWNRYDGSYEAQSFFTNYDAQADRAQLQYSTSLKKPPDLLQAPLRVTNTRARQNKNNLDRHFGNEEPEDEISLTTCGLVDPPFSENEVKLTAFKFGKRKSPGPEGIDNTVVKALVRIHPSLLSRLFNKCLDTGTFPEAWKVARVVLLEKSGRKGNSPNDYRPLSLLVCLGKVLDSLLAQRLKHWLESNELLSSFQHGFREGKSTTTALNEVLEGVEMGLNKGAWVLFVALDIDGAFNSMSWNKLMRNLMDMGFLIICAA
ncbi:hypothetical protein LAZ67_1003763 [Cordylochernes scorpioides]|uniref:Reverse transcriptase domain-containing protein n=1 Tax=Cordylochernes scorpioides TaxID=51811 RepID=A0ABY6JX87_9ARAC|nr:hypothetical protein LAZ67_1003763 [Cordylochernes scorpioides]